MWVKSSITAVLDGGEIVFADADGFRMGLRRVKGVAEVLEEGCAFPAQASLDE